MDMKSARARTGAPRYSRHTVMKKKTWKLGQTPYWVDLLPKRLTTGLLGPYILCECSRCVCTAITTRSGAGSHASLLHFTLQSLALAS